MGIHPTHRLFSGSRLTTNRIKLQSLFTTSPVPFSLQRNTAFYNSMPSLSKLPVEILLEIQSNLSYGSRIALRRTCHELYNKVDDPNRRVNGAQSSHAGLVQTMEKCYDIRDLLEIEMWPENNSAQGRPAGSKQPIPSVDFFACFLCRKIRCASKFSNAMMKGKRGKLGNGSVAEKSKRFCISCGIRVGIYKRGDWLQYGGSLGSCAFVCRNCGSFTPVGLIYFAMDERVCPNCDR
jgi:hypothetical protein